MNNGPTGAAPAEMLGLGSQLLAAAIEDSPDATLVVDNDGRIVMWNRRFLDLWRIAPELVKAGDDALVLASVALLVKDRASFLARVRDLYDHPEKVGHEEVELLDGRFLDRHTSVLHGDGGAYLGRIWYFREITQRKRLEAELREREERMQVIFDSVAVGIIVSDIETGVIADVNEKMTELLQYSRAELIAGGLALLSSDPPYDQVEAIRLVQLARDGIPQAFEWQNPRKDRILRWFDISLRRTVVAGRDVVLLTAHDITDRKESESKLVHHDRLLHAITVATAALVEHAAFDEGMDEALRIVGEAMDADGIVMMQYTADNDAPVFRFVWQPAPHGGLRADPARMPLTSDAFREWRARLQREGYVTSYAANATPGEAPLFAHLRVESFLVVPIYASGRYWGGFGLASRNPERAWSTVDIDMMRTFAGVLGALTERNASQAEVLHMARTDALTGLANRAVFVEALDRAITSAHRGGGFAVLYLDLDHFKDVNDTLGHPVGDLLLETIGKRLQEAVRSVDTIARFGGDEFALLEAGISKPDDAGALAEKILLALAEPVEIGGNVVQVKCSIGIAIYGPDALTAEALLGNADVALYRSKAEGRGTYRFFTERMNVEVHERFNLAAGLQRALRNSELFLVYRPQIEIDSGRLVGLEALVRWKRPGHGLVEQSTMDGIAEGSGLIVELGRWVVAHVCRQIRDWTDAGVTVPLVGVNFSALQFRMPIELESSLADALASTGVPAGALELELSELTLMQTTNEHSGVLQRLRASGFGLAIDDFGTGYSSLVYLREFPVDRIKIAETFVRSLLTNKGDSVIVRATIEMAIALGITVIAEGVETVDELHALRALGCRIVQGFYHPEPLAPAEVLSILRDGHALSAGL